MILDLSGYSTIVFDCDGVVLNSNRIKTDAFRSAAMPYGTPAAEALVQHNVANGGVSRYLKFEHFLAKIVARMCPGVVPGIHAPGLVELLAAYSQEVREGLMSCSVAEGLFELRSATKPARWMIVSGGDQEELSDVFMLRGISPLFDGGIFGSPEAKDQIVAREIKQGNILLPALFLGDSRLDYEVASRHGLDFVFLSSWTEFSEWESYTMHHSIVAVSHLRDLLLPSNSVIETDKARSS
jgi:phosphoglycolate phosphatase-like HAD superfamily hydrolase